MKNSEAIKIIKRLIRTVELGYNSNPLSKEGEHTATKALTLAIVALEFRERYDNFWEEVKAAGMSDLIERDKALDCFHDWTDRHGDVHSADEMPEYQAIEALPSARPMRKRGGWIPVDSYSAFGGDEATWIAHGNPVAFYYCSECKEQAYAGEDGESLITDYCPNCGAKMRGEQE